MRGVWCGVAFGLVLGGCASSAPLRFYTLSDVPPATAAASASAVIRMGRVRIPAELDRSQIVQRVDANRLRIAEQDRWAAPLDEMIRRTLAADLQARGAGAATNTPAAPSEGSAVLSLDIDEFVGDTTCAVTLRASWELKADGAPGAPIASGHELIRIPARAASACTAGSLPMPMSQAVAELSERILAARR
jgi:uncharacterized protein